MDPSQEFQREVASNIEKLCRADDLHELSLDWLRSTLPYHYSYNFGWLGRPIIQYPQDIVAMQELIWRIKPDLVIETGIAHGGSLIFSATMLSMLDYCDAVEAHTTLDPRESKRKVLGVDIDIRAHNRDAIQAHPMSHLIEMIQGSSIAADIVQRVNSVASKYRRILVCLDSNHTHEHVLAELNAYAPLVSRGSYCVVFDTVIEELPDPASKDRPWGRGNNPSTAVASFLSTLQQSHVAAADGSRLTLQPDKEIDGKLLISVAPRGYLRRI